MPEQRTPGGDQRSTGVPWWGAVLIAVSATMFGLAIEAGFGHRELGGIFATCFALGCVAAALTVRRSGLFTAVVQPPLLLFVTVPLAYYLFHESSFGGLKDALITCGYPLIERFPLMLFTTAATLMIGLIRWYLAMSAPAGSAGGRPAAAAPAGAERPGLLAALLTKLSSAFAGNGSVDEHPGERAARPRHSRGRSPTTRRARGPHDREPVRSRHSRAPIDDVEAAPPRRRRSDRDQARDGQRPAEPRRRPREPRRTPPPRRDPRDYRDPGYRDPAYRHAGDRDTPYRDYPYDRSPTDYPEYRDGRRSRGRRGQSRESAGYPSQPSYQPYPPSEPRRSANGAGDVDHHPVSRVRYRTSRTPDADIGDVPGNRPRR